MKKIEVFGSSHCPHCPDFKKKVDESGISYEYVDITDSMKNLKRFLKYRDNLKDFDGVKEDGRVGIPVMIIDETEVVFDVNAAIRSASTCGIEGC